jgi:hypothetical protein
MSYTFTSDISSNITSYLKDNSLNEIQTLIDESLTTIINNGSVLTTDISLIDDAYMFKKYLSDNNSIKTNNIMKILSTIPSDLDVKKDYETSKEDYELKNGLNSTTMQTFLEKYLFVIIKIVFFLVCFLLLYFATRNSDIQVGRLVDNLKVKVSETKSQAQGVIEKITNNNPKL